MRYFKHNSDLNRPASTPTHHTHTHTHTHKFVLTICGDSRHRVFDVFRHSVKFKVNISEFYGAARVRRGAGNDIIVK